MLNVSCNQTIFDCPLTYELLNRIKALTLCKGRLPCVEPLVPTALWLHRTKPPGHWTSSWLSEACRAHHLGSSPCLLLCSHCSTWRTVSGRGSWTPPKSSTHTSIAVESPCVPASRHAVWVCWDWSCCRVWQSPRPAASCRSVSPSSRWLSSPPWWLLVPMLLSRPVDPSTKQTQIKLVNRLLS